MDTVKMPEVTVIANVAFMVFAMFAVVRRVSRAASCVASCVSARVTTMTAAALTVLQSYPQPEKSSSPLAEATRSADFEIT